MSNVPYLQEIDDRFAALEAVAVGGALASGKIIVGSAGGLAAAQTMSGDATIAANGTLTIANGAVSVAKLAAAAQPSHVVKYAGKHTTVGGNASEAITVTGVAATDVVFVQLQDKGASPQTIVTAKPSLNTITVVFSADPAADHVVSYQVLRAV